MSGPLRSAPFPAGTPKADAALNIFAKPWQTALSVLSLIRYAGTRLGVIHLQYEPFGSRYDRLDPMLLSRYVSEELGRPCALFQPGHWLDLKAPDPARLNDRAYRLGIRYQAAFENSGARHLLLLHNDVFIFRDVLGALLDAAQREEREQGRAPFAAGRIGQCWNCPAGNAALMRDLFDLPACAPEHFEEYRPLFAGPSGPARLQELYGEARKRGMFTRPYDASFSVCSWPLPECRVNEWACLIDLAQTRPLTVPLGGALPPGAFSPCGDRAREGEVTLDTGVAWFRSMYAHGLRAAHLPVESCMKHWGGTGRNTERAYRLAEDNARMLLERHFPAFIRWLAGQGSLPPR